jgi:hypothetical protein
MPMKPPSKSVRNSSSFPKPPRILRATLVASNSSHSSEPVSRSRRRRFRTFHRPIQKSKSRALGRWISAAYAISASLGWRVAWTLPWK